VLKLVTQPENSSVPVFQTFSLCKKSESVVFKDYVQDFFVTEEYLLLFSRVMKDSSYGGWEAEGGLPVIQGFGGPRPHYANSDVADFLRFLF
jgi:hypothetical protein